ncbi:MAG TPA: hypothetical protein VG095_06390 [Chthoniobacterales bacterium]|nr:hypothetical protein [Chthoniobacterales bacterium]
MLDQIRKLLLLGFAAGLLTACAAKEEPQLVSTGADRESSLPWNKQERWENTGQFGAMAEELSGARR